MNVFISQPMAGLTDEEILKRRNELIEMISTKFKGETIQVIDSFHKPDELVKKGRIAMLGHSISMMYNADIVVFATGWDKSPGCRVEHEVCVQYKLMRFYEDILWQEHKPPSEKKE